MSEQNTETTWLELTTEESVQLRHHLRYNIYPPQPTQFDAIKLTVEEYRNGRVKVDQKVGVAEYGVTLSLTDIIEWYRLEFLFPDLYNGWEDEMETEEDTDDVFDPDFEDGSDDMPCSERRTERR